MQILPLTNLPARPIIPIIQTGNDGNLPVFADQRGRITGCKSSRGEDGASTIPEPPTEGPRGH